MAFTLLLMQAFMLRETNVKTDDAFDGEAVAARQEQCQMSCNKILMTLARFGQIARRADFVWLKRSAPIRIGLSSKRMGIAQSSVHRGTIAIRAGDRFDVSWRGTCLVTEVRPPAR